MKGDEGYHERPEALMKFESAAVAFQLSTLASLISMGILPHQVSHIFLTGSYVFVDVLCKAFW